MMETKNENSVAKMLDGDFKIHVQKLGRLLEPAEKSQNLKMYIEFNDLCYSVRHNPKGTEKMILQNVTGHFEPGKVTVIIGPSGAGKTTLLKIISGERLINSKGTITVNGVERNKDTFRKQVCYVPQQFNLLPFLTTKETLYIATRLKLDINQTKQAICSVVNDIAESLGLSNCLDTLANKLSGGERKRLSIGVEMIVKPSVFLLDEPTSGLDSTASNQLINMLHDMAKANSTVVCAIHQPSSQMISLFDDIMVLNRGRCMYCGPKSEILNTYGIAGFTYLSYYNIAEFVLKIITEQRDEDLDNLYKICRDAYERFRLGIKPNELATSSDSEQKFKTNDLYTSVNNVIQKKSMWQEQKILFLRSLIYIKRDITMTKIRLSTHILTGLLLGILFYNFGDDAEKAGSNMAYLFFSLIFLFLLNAVLSAQMFPTEEAVFLQEHLNNWYSLKSYYSVKILSDLLVQVPCASSYVFISYYLTGQPMEYNRVLGAWSICLLITIVAQTFGILVGIVFGAELGIFVVPSSNIPLLLFTGFFLKIGEMSTFLQYLSSLSYFRYAFEGLMQVIYVDRLNLTCMEIYCYFGSPQKILTIMGVPTVPFYAILIILGSWIIGLHVVSYAILRWKIYNARK